MKWVRFLAGTILFAVCVLPNHAADRLWTGAVSSNWFDADNWQPAGVPAPEDDVTVTKANVSVPADAIVAGLNFNTGTISTTNTITVTHLNWGNSPETSVGSATFSGAGRVVIPPDGALVFRGDSTCVMRTGVVQNFGRAVNATSRGLLLFNNAVFHNAGRFEIHTNFNFDGANGPPGGVVSNSGTLVVTGQTTRVSFFVVDFRNSGRTELHQGVFACGSGSSIGPIDISLTATQQITGPLFTLGPGASFPGAGLLLHARGTIDAGTVDQMLPNYRFELGTLTGTNTFVISNFVWAGGTISGQGLVRIPSAGVLSITPGSATRTLQARELRHEGIGSQSGPGNLDVNLQSGGLFHNAGMFFTAGGYWFGGGPGARGFYNSGTLIRTNQSGETPFYTPITNAGRVRILGGNLRPLFGYVQIAGSTEMNEGTRLDWGPCLILGGKLIGAGRVTGPLVNHGELHPGNPIGSLRITGPFTNYGRIFIDLTDNPSLVNDQVIVESSARIHGTMSVCLRGAPPAGAAFPVLSSASLTNAFARIDGLDVGGGRALVPVYGPTGLLLVVQNAGGTLHRLSLAPCADSDYQVRFTGFPGDTYEIQTSSNLMQWTPLWTTNSASGIIYFLDDAGELPHRFYRAVRRP